MLKLTWCVVVMLVLATCGTPPPAGPSAKSAPATLTVPPPTKDEYMRQFCAAMVAYEERHRAWHAAHSDLNDHHFDESFVSIVQDPVLPLFENPPASDRAVIAAMRATFQQASVKFREAAQQWQVGDKQAAEAAENEAFKLLFEDFATMYTNYGITEQRCTALGA